MERLSKLCFIVGLVATIVGIGAIPASADPEPVADQRVSSATKLTSPPSLTVTTQTEAQSETVQRPRRAEALVVYVPPPRTGEAPSVRSGGATRGSRL